jgi:hypothetical protein
VHHAGVPGGRGSYAWWAGPQRDLWQNMPSMGFCALWRASGYNRACTLGTRWFTGPLLVKLTLAPKVLVLCSSAGI